MALTKRTCAGLLLEPQLAVRMLKAARANGRGRALNQRDILNSPRVSLVVSKKDFSSLFGGSPGLGRGPVPFPERFPELCN
jgi:hypothetical protein